MGGGSDDVTVGYKYYVGMHMALCHGPADKLVQIRVGGKKAWVGGAAGGQIYIDKPKLFGGEKREGGVRGYVDIEMGEQDQGQNSYLASKLGSSLLPAFRGVMCAVLRQVYVGLNPYLKDWGWLVQRIHKSTNGATQWYDAKAEIGGWNITVFNDHFETLDGFTLVESGTFKYPKTELFGLVYQDGVISFYNRYDFTQAYGTFGSTAGNTTQITSVCDRSIWINKKIDVPRGVVTIRVEASHDDGAQYWVDGVLVTEDITYSSSGGGLTGTDIFTFRVDGPKQVSVTQQVINCRDRFGESAGTSEAIHASMDIFVTFVDEQPAGGGQTGDYADMNPAHIVRECLTDTNWGMGYPESDIDDDSFTAAADALFNEEMGISILWSQQTSIEDFVGEILRHIDAALYVDRSTGKFVLKLIRDDYDESSLLVLESSNISRVDGYTKQTLAELINEVTVTYNSNESFQTETATLQNIALIQQQGAIIPSSVDYPGFTNETIALKVCSRDLKAMAWPLVSATIYANREAAGLNIGDVFRWDWTEHDEDGIGVSTSYVMRVTEIAFGDGLDNAVRIQCVQDVFALPDITYAQAEATQWADPAASPLPASPRLITEAPYYQVVRQLGELDATSKLTSLPELGFLMVAAGRQASEINADIYVDSGAGYADGGTLDFCPCAALDGALGVLDTSATLKDDVDIDEVEENSLAQIDEEIIVIESITDGVATIRRGCLDTIPAAHADGAAVVIWDGYTSSDSVEYVDSDAVSVKLLPVTGGGALDIDDAPSDSVIMDQRANRPYRPAGLAANGDMSPDRTVQVSFPLPITWAHRNRLQETGGTILEWDDASVTVESGVTYRFLAEELDSSGAYIRDAIDESVNGASRSITDTDFSSSAVYLRITVIAQRGGVDSWQSPSIEVGVNVPSGAATIDGSNITIDGSPVTIG